MPSVLRTTCYTCAQCEKDRHFEIQRKDHDKRIKSSANGLAEYSDLHACFDGLLSITNLHIDADFNIRSFSFLELPGKKATSTINGIPSPSMKFTNRFHIAPLDFQSYRLVLEDDPLFIRINLGHVGPDEKPLDTFVSDNKQVRIEYYDCEKKLWRWTKKWFRFLVNTLEKLPPTTLGLLVATLKYVYENHNNEPSALEEELIENVLICHKISFEVLKVKSRFRRINALEDKYGLEQKNLFKSLLKDLESDDNIVLTEIVEKYQLDLVYLIYLFLILENEGLIKINRNLED